MTVPAKDTGTIARTAAVANSVSERLRSIDVIPINPSSNQGLKMPREHGPWTIRESHHVYRNPFIEVVEDQVTRPDGQPGIYGTVTMKPGVAILPVDPEGVVYLTKEFRYAIGRESLEVAGGAIDEGESPAEAARREAREELGIDASEWTDLGRIDPFTSVIHSPASMFVARGLTFTSTEHEGTEAIEVVKVPFDEAVLLVMDGTITHGPSCVLILKAARVLGR